MERKQNRQSKPKKQNDSNGGTRRSSRRKRMRYYILAAVIVAVLVFVGVRAHAISRLSGQIETDEARMKLTAMAEQDVSALQDEIDLKREVEGVVFLSGETGMQTNGGTNGTSDNRFSVYEGELPASDLTKSSSFFRRFAAVCRRLGGSREQNGVLFGQNRQLMEDIVVADDETLDLKANALNAYAAKHEEVQTHLLLVPDAAGLLRDQLPNSIEVADQEELFADFANRLDTQIVWMDGFSALRAHTDEKLYYQTDHHWTSEGAYAMFLETARDLGITDASSVAYDSYCAVYDFNGTLSEVSSFLRGEKEEILVSFPREYTSYLVSYPDEGETLPTLYSVDALDSEDPYAVFLDGCHPLVEINTGSDNMETLLVVKDSFANSFIPYLIPYYSRILVVDPASYSGSLDTLTEVYGVNDVLFLYDGNSFFSDTNLTRNLLAD